MNSELNPTTHSGNGIERLHDSETGHDSVLHRASERAAQLRESARDLVRRGSDTVLDKASAVRDSALHVGDRTRGYVRDEPMKSMLMAAAVGAGVAVAVVLLLSSSRHHEHRTRRFY